MGKMVSCQVGWLDGIIQLAASGLHHPACFVLTTRNYHYQEIGMVIRK
jgi:hypothetical protein